MSKKLSFVLIMSLLLLLFHTGCEKNEVNNYYINPSPKLLVFLSDFDQNSDVAISIMGSLHSKYPELQIEYIQASPFNLKQAAYQLEVAAREYPDSTFLMGLVEPGTSARRMVFEVSGGKKLVVPDNGLASRVFRYLDTLNCYYIENPLDDTGSDPYDLNVDEFYLLAISGVISGRPLNAFGSAVQQPVTYLIQDPVTVNDTVYGEVIFTDNFGNCITNIPEPFLDPFVTGTLLGLTCDTHAFFATYGTDYSSVPVGQNVVLVDRSNRVQLSVNYGDLSQRYSLGSGSAVKLYKGTVRIGILQFNDISSAFVEIMKNELQSNGFDFEENTVLIEKTANGDLSKLHGLVSEVLDAGVDILVPFSTPAAQAVVIQAPETVPVVFSIVTDPVSAGILDQRPHVTGLSNATDMNAFIDFTKRVWLDLSIAGSIYNSQESNSVVAQQQLADLFPFHGIGFVHSAVTAADEISAAYQEVVAANAQVIMISNDNTMTSATADLVELALKDTIPVLGTDYANAQHGALAAISVDYDLIAWQTGDMVSAVIRGVDPDDMPVRYFPTTVIAVNTQTAASMGYQFDPEVLKEATYIYP